MFKVFGYRQLLLITLVLCFMMLMGALLNTISPYVTALSQNCISLPIVMYHQISENGNYGDYILPLSILEADFRYFKDKGINPISFKQLLAFCKAGITLPPNPIIITFDDGERSFLTKVVPLLEKYRYPANVNIIGSLSELYTKNGDTNDAYAYLNYNDIEILHNHSLVELGCHTYNLHSLNNRRGVAMLKGETESQYLKIISRDINRFNNMYKNITGDSLFIFAYPYGIKNDVIAQYLDESGYKITLTSREAVNRLSPGSSLNDLGRFNRPYGINPEDFYKKLF